MYEIQEAKFPDDWKEGGELIVYTQSEDDIDIIKDAFERSDRIVYSNKISDNHYRIKYAPDTMKSYLCGELNLRKEGVISYAYSHSFIINYDPEDKIEAVRSFIFLLWGMGIMGAPDRADINKAIDGKARYFYMICDDEKDIIAKYEKFLTYIKSFDHLKLENIILYMSGSLFDHNTLNKLDEMCVNLIFDRNEERWLGHYHIQMMDDEIEKGLMISAFVHYA